MIRTQTYFTLYDNSIIRRAKIELTFPSSKLSWVSSGTAIGSILPCNPTNYVDLYSSGSVKSTNGQQIVRVDTDGYLYGFGGYSNTGGYNGSEYVRSGYNGTYYWPY